MPWRRMGGVEVQFHAFLTSAVSFTTRPLYPRENKPRYQLNRWLGGPQSRSGRGVEEKKFLPLSEIEAQSFNS